MFAIDREKYAMAVGCLLAKRIANDSHSVRVFGLEFTSRDIDSVLLSFRCS